MPRWLEWVKEVAREWRWVKFFRETPAKRPTWIVVNVETATAASPNSFPTWTSRAKPRLGEPSMGETGVYSRFLEYTSFRFPA